MDRLNEMEAFVRVVDLGGFTDAARKLGLSKSAVSKHVASLEDRLGARLLNRTTRRVSPTDIGLAFYDRAIRVLAEAREAFWAVIRDNIETRADIAAWWQVVAEGAEPGADPEDAAFVAEALAILPEPPYGPEAWAEWTAAVKAQSGRKGKALFMPLRKALTGRARGPEMADFMPLMRARPKP